MTKKLVIKTRGSYSGKDPDNTASFAFIIYRNSNKIKEGHGILEQGEDVDHNFAEYKTIIRALNWLKKEGLSSDKLIIKSNSDLVVNQMKDKWGVKSKKLKSLYTELKELTEELEQKSVSVKFEKISKEDNQRAIELSELALKDMATLSKIKKKSQKKCPKCGGKLVVRKGKFGRFYGCSNYPDCDYTEKVDK